MSSKIKGMMNGIILTAVLIALLAGFAIGGQSTLGSLSQRLIGPAQTGLLMNMAGGALAAVFALSLFALGRLHFGEFAGQPLLINLIAGFLGIIIVGSVAFSVGQIGVTAALATVIFGQMLIGTVVDAAGLAGGEPISLSVSRIAGLVVMGLAIYLLLPRG